MLLFGSFSSAPLLAAPTIVIDAGHGGRDGGAYWGGVKEKDLTLRLAGRVESELRARGLRTAMTRRRDVFIPLGGRAAAANRHRNAILVSLHFDASRDKRVRGLTVYHAGPAGKVLAGKLAAAIGRPGGIRNRGAVRRNLAVLRNTRGAAVLIECGFVSNDVERRLCRSAAFQAQLAKGIVRGLSAHVRK